MLVFNTLFKHVRLLFLYIKGLAPRLKNAIAIMLTAILRFTHFGFSLLLFIIKKKYRDVKNFIVEKTGPITYLFFKISVLVLLSIAFTAVAKTYLFQKIMAERMIKTIGNNVKVSEIDLGIYNFSHDCVTIKNLEHFSSYFQLSANEIDVSYDFLESMKDEAKINIINFKAPVLTINDFNAFLNYIAANHAIFKNGGMALSKLPKMSVLKGRIALGGMEASLENLCCEITPLTDNIVFLKARAELKESKCSITFNVTINLEKNIIKYGGKIYSARLETIEKAFKPFLKKLFIDRTAGEADIEFSGAFSFDNNKNEIEFKTKLQNCKIITEKYPHDPLIIKNANLRAAVTANAANISHYSLEINDTKLYFKNKNIDYKGEFSDKKNEFSAFIDSLTPFDYELFTDKPLPDALKKYAPDMTMSYSHSSSRQEAKIKALPRNLFKIYNGIEIKFSGGEFFIVKASDEISIEANFGLALNDWPPFIFNVRSSGGATDYAYEIKGIGEGIVKLYPDFTLSNLRFKSNRQSDPRVFAGGFSIDFITDCSQAKKLILSVSDLNAFKLISLLFPTDILSSTARYIHLRQLSSLDLVLSGYFEQERFISQFSLFTKAKNDSLKSKAEQKQPFLAGALSLLNFSSSPSYYFKLITSAGKAIEISPITNNFISHELIKYIDKENMTFIYSGNSANSHLEFNCAGIRLECEDKQLLHLNYLSKAGVEINGDYNLISENFKAKMRLIGDNAPELIKKICNLTKSQIVSIECNTEKLTIKGFDNAGELQLNLSANVKKSDTQHLKFSMSDVVFETPSIFFNGSAALNAQNMQYSISGTYRPKLAAGNPLNSLSFKVTGDGTLTGDKSSISLKLASSPICNAATMGMNVEYRLPEGKINKISNIKLADLKGEPLIDVSIENFGSKQSPENCHQISYKSQKGAIIKFLSSSTPEELLKFSAFFLNNNANLNITELIAGLKTIVKEIEVNGKITLKNFAFDSHEMDVSARLLDSTNISASFETDEKCKNIYRSKLFNFNIGNITYKAECEIDIEKQAGTIKTSNNKIPLAAILEKISGEKCDAAGTLNLDSSILLKPGSVDINASCSLHDSKVDTDKIVKVLNAKKRGKYPEFINLNIEVTLGASNYILSQDLNALVEGSFCINGTPNAPSLSGNIDIVRGKLNYFSRTFDIESGGFRLSTLKNVSKLTENKSGQPRVAKPEKAQIQNNGFNYKLNVNDFKNFSFKQGGSDVEVYMYISAALQADDYDVTLSLSGSPGKLNVYLTSKPELSQEAIHMLLYGVKPDPTVVSGGGEQLTSGKFIDAINSQVQDAIYQRLSNSLEKKFNLDEVRINTYTANTYSTLGNKNGGTSELLRNFNHYTDVEVKIGKYVDPALYLSYSKNLYSPKSDSIGMEYKVRKKLFVDGKVNQSMEYRVGAKYGIPF